MIDLSVHCLYIVVDELIHLLERLHMERIAALIVPSH
jgi:hypothetical protein